MNLDNKYRDKDNSIQTDREGKKRKKSKVPKIQMR